MNPKNKLSNYEFVSSEIENMAVKAKLNATELNKSLTENEENISTKAKPQAMYVFLGLLSCQNGN